jgi:hypothetical protein
MRLLNLTRNLLSVVSRSSEWGLGIAAFDQKIGSFCNGRDRVRRDERIGNSVGEQRRCVASPRLLVFMLQFSSDMLKLLGSYALAKLLGFGLVGAIVIYALLSLLT